MRDGSYYEGEFLNGEIHGTGTRLWSHTNNIYQGQFDQGEMNGMGVMTYGESGDVYEGHWVDNKAEGVLLIFFYICVGRLLFVCLCYRKTLRFNFLRQFKICRHCSDFRYTEY